MGVMKIPDEVMQRVCRQWNDTSSACSGGEIRVDSGSEHTYPEKSCGYHMWGASRDGAKCGHLKPYDEGDAHLYTTLADDATSCCKPNDSGNDSDDEEEFTDAEGHEGQDHGGASGSDSNGDEDEEDHVALPNNAALGTEGAFTCEDPSAAILTFDECQQAAAALAGEPVG